MTKVNRWIREYADKQTFQPPSTTALKAMNFIMAIQSFVVGLLMFGPEGLFLQPASPPDAWWLSPAAGSVGLWEVVFVVGAVLLALATGALKWVVQAHGLMVVIWLTFGLTWTIGGILNAPSYLFGVGILGIFIALQHVGLMGVWRAEGI